MTGILIDINEECRRRDLERIFQKYGPLKEIWLASYAPFYAFIVYQAKRDAEVRETYQDAEINQTICSTLQTACSRANGVSISGRRIRVSMAKPRIVGPRNRKRSGD